MQWFNDMKIGKRLGLGFGVVLMLLVTLIWVGISRMQQIQHHLDRIVNVNNVRSDLANEMDNSIVTVMLSMRDLLLEKDKSKDQESFFKIKATREKYSESFKKAKEMTSKDDKKGNEIIARIE